MARHKPAVCVRKFKRSIKKSYRDSVPLFKNWKAEREFWRDSDSPRSRWFYNKLQ